MYPDWPRTASDLVPLPECDGPKLKPFDFQGPQSIEFLDYVGEGLHAHVFKVTILGQIYALKLFRFNYEDNWLEPARDTDLEDRVRMSTFYKYSEPFSCECRAFGRLQEAARARGAGDPLLRIRAARRRQQTGLQTSFPEVDFNGDIDFPGDDDMRSRYLGRDGRDPPIRGILEEFRPPMQEDELDTAAARKILRNVSLLQQLGILYVDVATRQQAGGQMADFSTAITIPDFVTTAELNPGLAEKMRLAMELETFRLAREDYAAFDAMVQDFNYDFGKEKSPIAIRALPATAGYGRLYSLRNVAAREHVSTRVDPRRYDWKRRGAGTGKKCRRLRSKPPVWICRGDPKMVAELREPNLSGPTLSWDFKDGHIFPRV